MSTAGLLDDHSAPLENIVMFFRCIQNKNPIPSELMAEILSFMIHPADLTILQEYSTGLLADVARQFLSTEPTTITNDGNIEEPRDKVPLAYRMVGYTDPSSSVPEKFTEYLRIRPFHSKLQAVSIGNDIFVGTRYMSCVDGRYELLTPLANGPKTLSDINWYKNGKRHGVSETPFYQGIHKSLYINSKLTHYKNSDDKGNVLCIMAGPEGKQTGFKIQVNLPISDDSVADKSIYHNGVEVERRTYHWGNPQWCTIRILEGCYFAFNQRAMVMVDPLCSDIRHQVIVKQYDSREVYYLNGTPAVVKIRGENNDRWEYHYSPDGTLIGRICVSGHVETCFRGKYRRMRNCSTLEFTLTDESTGVLLCTRDLGPLSYTFTEGISPEEKGKLQTYVQTHRILPYPTPHDWGSYP